MEYEMYIIEVGVKKNNYLRGYFETWGLTPDLSMAERFYSVEATKNHIDGIKCLKGKTCRIKKLVCKLEEEAIEEIDN